MKDKKVTLIGGSGFLGTYLVKKLTERGARVKVVCRHPEKAKHIRVNGPTGRVVIQAGNIRDDASMERAIAGSDVVVNLVGILFQHGKQRFEEVQAQGAERVARIAKEAGAKQFVQISALGSDKNSSSRYARSKLTGEQAVANAFPKATILRPSVLFGIEDDFFNKFASFLSFSPFFPLIGGGKTKFQPVYVGDVAEAICRVLETSDYEGKIIELGGPEVISMKAVLEYIKKHIHSCTCLIPVPFSLIGLASSFLELAPTPPLTRDQVKLLKTDNIVDENAIKLHDLGITPTPINAIVPHYLKRYKGQQ